MKKLNYKFGLHCQKCAAVVLHLVRVPNMGEAFRAEDCAYPDGTPVQQNDEYPPCPSCGGEISFQITLVKRRPTIGDRLRDVLCGPDGAVEINGSESDRAIIADCLKELDELEKRDE